jgi:hypothetical protein
MYMTINGEVSLDLWSSSFLFSKEDFSHCADFLHLETILTQPVLKMKSKSQKELKKVERCSGREEGSVAEVI